MATNPEAESWINAGTQLVNTGANIFASASADRRGRKWAEKQYAKQRADALTDWAMQNEYNSPAAQMARLKAAKLNPRLIYGDSSNMPAAANIRQSDTGSYRPVVPELSGIGNAGSALLTQYDLRLKAAQTDNIKATLDVLKQDAILKAAQTAQISMGTARSEFDLKLATDLKTNTIEQAKANLQKTYADTTFTLNADERATAMQAYNIRSAVENVLNLRASRSKMSSEKEHIQQSIQNLKTDNAIKEQDLRLKKMNIQPHDAAFIRAVQEAVNKYMPTPEKVVGNVKDIYEKGVKPFLDKYKKGGYKKYP